MNHKIEPFGEKVLVEPLPDKDTKDGIFIPEEAREKQSLGIIRGVGTDHARLKEGKQVLYSTYAGVELNYNEKIYRVLRYEDIQAIINQ